MYDLIIKNGTVYDGTGRKPFFAEVAIKGNKIVAIGELEESSKLPMAAILFPLIATSAKKGFSPVPS